MSSHRAILSALANWGLETAARIAAGRLDAPEENPEFQPSILMAFPLFHVGGSHASLLPSFGVGRKVVMMYRWDPEQALNLIERERITAFLGVPTMTWELLHAPSLSKRDLRSLVAVAGGGSGNPGGMVERLQERLPGQHWTFGWGMTETNAGGMANMDDGSRRAAGELRPSLSRHRAQADRPRRQRTPAGRAGGAGPQVGDEHALLLEPAGGDGGGNP